MKKLIAHKSESPGGAGQFAKSIYLSATDSIAETLAVVRDNDFPTYSVFALLQDRREVTKLIVQRNSGGAQHHA